MNQQSALNILLAVLALVWILSRQLRARRVREQRPYSLVVLLAAVGLYQIAELAGQTPVSRAAYAALAAGLGTGALFGWLRGRHVHLWRADGVLTSQGDGLTVVLWVAGLAVHVALDGSGVLLSGHQGGVTSLGAPGILLYLAVSLGAQRLTALSRAAQLDGAAPAPVR